MAKMFIDLTKAAEAAGMKLTVSVSQDFTEARYKFNNGEAEEFESVFDATRWLDGYARGRVVERAQKGGIC